MQIAILHFKIGLLVNPIRHTARRLVLVIVIFCRHAGRTLLCEVGNNVTLRASSS